MKNLTINNDMHKLTLNDVTKEQCLNLNCILAYRDDECSYEYAWLSILAKSYRFIYFDDNCEPFSSCYGREVSQIELKVLQELSLDFSLIKIFNTKVIIANIQLKELMNYIAHTNDKITGNSLLSLLDKADDDDTAIKSFLRSYKFNKLFSKNVIKMIKEDIPPVAMPNCSDLYDFYSEEYEHMVNEAWYLDEDEKYCFAAIGFLQNNEIETEYIIFTYNSSTNRWIDTLSCLYENNILGFFCEVEEKLEDGRLKISLGGETLIINEDVYNKLFLYLNKSTCSDTVADASNLSGTEFENLIQTLVQKMGFEVTPTKATGDGGIDLIAYNHQPFLDGKYIIQCKRWGGSVGEPILRDLYGVITAERANKGILVTTSYFTQSAINFAEGKPIELVDGDKLNILLGKYGLLDANPAILEKQKSKMLSDILDYDYDDYMELCNELQRNTANKDANQKIIDLLYGYASPGSCDNVSNEQRILLANCCIEHIKNVERHFNKSGEEQIFIRSFYMLIRAGLNVIIGDFAESISLYERVFDWTTFANSDKIDNGLIGLLWDTAFNLAQLYTIVGTYNKCGQLIKRYNWLFGQKKKAYQNRLSKDKNAPQHYFRKAIKQCSSPNVVSRFNFIEYNNSENQINNAYDKYSKCFSLDFLLLGDMSLFVDKKQDRLICYDSIKDPSENIKFVVDNLTEKIKGKI